MKNKAPLLVGIVGIFLLFAAFFIWQKSQAPVVPSAVPQESSSIKQVDLNTQPEWVQKLVVTAKKGVSGNGLSNFTLKVTGLPKDTVKTLSYIVQYQTSNKGVQGALAMTPLTVTGTEFSKVIDLGTCSTKSCVRHDGVTSVEIELDFTLFDSSTAAWTGVVDLK